MGDGRRMIPVKLAAILKDKTVDLIDCSTGGNIPDVKITLKPLYQVGFAESIKKATGILTGAVGLINTPQEANSVIEENKADLFSWHGSFCVIRISL